MDLLIEKIEKYVLSGFMVKEIVELMDETIKKEYGSDYDKFYLLVKNIYDEPRNNWPKEDYEKLKEKRKNRLEAKKEETIKKIGLMVKEETLKNENNHLVIKESLHQAIKKVAASTGLTTQTVVKYVKLTDVVWFNETLNSTVSVDYLIHTIERVISKNMYSSESSRVPYYTKAVDYVKENRPDLYEALRKNYDSHKSYQNIEVSKKKEYFKNIDILMNIIFEFRVPLTELYEFLTKTSDMFLLEPINSKEELENVFRTTNSYHRFYSMNWYLYEATSKDDYTDYRINRFKEFQEKFFALETKEEQFRYVIEKTYIDLSKIKEKIENKSYVNGHYGFDINDYRNMLRWCYNYSLDTPEMEQLLGVPKMKKREMISVLETSNDIYDQMICDGAQRLSEYNQTVAYSMGIRKY